MRDKAGQVYSTVGGLVAGAGSGALLSGATNAFVGWVAPMGAGAAVATAIGLYVSLAAMLDWWLPGRKSSLASVIMTAQALSGEIAVWSGERGQYQSGILFDDYGPADSHDAWQRRTSRIITQSNDTMARWNERFAVRALTSYDQLVAHGAEDPEGKGRFAFEHPTNSLGIEDAGRTLGVMAAHLEAKKMPRH